MCDNRTDLLRSLPLTLQHAGTISNCTHHLTTTTHSVNITSPCFSATSWFVVVQQFVEDISSPAVWRLPF